MISSTTASTSAAPQPVDYPASGDATPTQDPSTSASRRPPVGAHGALSEMGRRPIPTPASTVRGVSSAHASADLSRTGDSNLDASGSPSASTGAAARRVGTPTGKLRAAIDAIHLDPNAQIIDKAGKDAAARAAVTMKVDLGTFRSNYRDALNLIKDRQKTDVSVVLKADGYGVGAIELAKAFEKEGCNKFFVATIDEAIKMRAAVKPETTVLVLGGPLRGTAQQFIEHNLTPVLGSLQQVEEWNDLGHEHGKKLPAFLQFDTGMSRSGIPAADRTKVKPDSDLMEFVDIKCVMSHLATADEATADAAGNTNPSESMEKQHNVFTEIMKDFEGVKASFGASSGLHVEKYQHDLVRFGGLLHGQQIFGDGHGSMPQPVTVTGRLAEVRKIGEGAGVGYGLVHKATGDEYIGTIQAGYNEAPKALGETTDADGKGVINGHVKVNGEMADVVGKVSMDMLTFKLNDKLVDQLAAPLHGRMQKSRDIDDHGVDPDPSLWLNADGSERSTPAAGRLFDEARVVFSDQEHTFDKVAAEARTNSSEVSIRFGNSPRGRKVYVDDSDAPRPPATPRA
ncbi:alanine racemase [Paraburkholderia solisilvae]|uniref:Alanine racemase n=1 Tax=Paraburkholderia solisilvae TaxID=624376 RepID=A0A6J5EW08_9BURK|nr:alanine racemase [Paraburkholderia solisilvae]CAB3769386.1 Alanine racemase [Paraburkholderia solisilvae]